MAPAGPVPADEYPVHQAPLSLRHTATSDRNAYDRCYFNAHDRTGDVFFVAGLGVYPALGVIDGFATLRRGDRQVTVRASDALGDDRLDQRVGPLRVEVVEPLRRIRLVGEGTGGRAGGGGASLAYDLEWEGSFPAVEEARHHFRQGDRVILDACRFAQVGTWAGEIVVGGERLEVGRDVWVGTRDRSWGIRPVGDPEPPGRAADEPIEGFWWTYVPLRFDDFAVVVIVQEEPDGTRILNDAVRVWPGGSGRAPEQLGWPETEIRYRPGTRHPEAAVLHLTAGAGPGERRRAVRIEVETLGFVALNCGPGYGGDPEWLHGQWRGRGWTEVVEHDLTDPAVAGRVPFGVVDHVARAVWHDDGGGDHDGAVGHGMFEHGTFGRHDPSGFAGWDSVAPQDG